MANPQNRRRRERRSLALDTKKLEALEQMAAARDATQAASYIDELRPSKPSTAPDESEQAVTVEPAHAETIAHEVEAPRTDEPDESRGPSSDDEQDDEARSLATIESTEGVAANDVPNDAAEYGYSEADLLDDFERRLAGRRALPRIRVDRRAALWIGAVATVAAAGIGLRHHAHHTTAHAIAPHAAAMHPQAVAAPAPTPVPAQQPVAAPEAAQPTTAAAALATDVALPQPTAQLDDLLDVAVRARSHGVREATEAMDAWMSAGGNDARSVAQFAYWLGRREELQRAETWAERATTLDPRNQTAWYVLGATRLEDEHAHRSDAYTALRHCADLPGPFTMECLGPFRRGGAASRR